MKNATPTTGQTNRRTNQHAASKPFRLSAGFVSQALRTPLSLLSPPAAPAVGAPLCGSPFSFSLPPARPPGLLARLRAVHG